MARPRKKIKLRYGKGIELAKALGVSVQTVSKAMRWNTDSDTENLIRQRAKELGFIKQF